jgi:two-component sensor histidine kinase
MPMIPTDFSAILQGMPQPYLVLDSSLAIVGASDAYLELTERTRDEIVGRHILEAFPENPDAAGTVEQGPLEVSLRHVLATGKQHAMAVIQYDIPRPEGGFFQKFWTPVHSPVLNADGIVHYIIQNPMDVTESVVAARESDARLRVALHAADMASWEYEPDTDFWRRSHQVDETFGFSPGEGGPVAKAFFERVHPDDLPRVMETVRGAMECPDQTVINFGYRIMLPTGEVKYIASRGEVLRTSGGQIRMIGVLMDVTADRLREAELDAAVAAQGELLEQKDLLLAEVNHRVKNSLQLVVSTLRLQARRLEDEATIAAFDRAISRVRAIVSVHERLYRTDNSFAVDMAEHLRSLSLDIAADSAGRFEVDVDAMELKTECAIPISVIVNELLASMKQDENSTATVSLKIIGEGRVELAVRGANQSNALSDLSARLVRSMVAQIEGVFEENLDGGRYRATVVFSRDVC